MSMSLRRRGLAAALVTLSVAASMTVAAGPAAASRHLFLEPTSFARTDSRAPHTTITTGDAIVGAYRDDHGRHHVTKTYLTFDITSLRGKQLFAAEINLAELSANDCTTPRAIELWLTKPPRHTPTWANAPKEILRLDGPGSTTGCPPEHIGFSAGEALNKAVAAGWDTMTIVLRITKDKQRDLAYGRTYSANTGLLTTYNTAPATPTTLTTANQPCGAPAWIASRDVRVRGTASDPDGDSPLTARVAHWPTDDPASRVERTGSAYSTFDVTIPQAQLADGREYAWQVRAEDPDGAVSAWSPPCTFTTDWTRPSTPPTVSSQLYPPTGTTGGGDGIPGDFTFTANGVQDVVAYEYEGIGMPRGRVNVNEPGSPATVSLTPRGAGPRDLSVRSVDRAGNLSEATLYRFWVDSTAPYVNAADRIPPGEQLPVTFTAQLPGSTTLIYQLNQQPETTLPIGVDGTATVTLTLPPGDSHELRAWTTNAAGWRSGIARHSVRVDVGEPTITSTDYPEWTLSGAPGTPGTFHFAATFQNITEYRYSFDEEPETTVPATPNSTATVTYTPTRSGFMELRVYAITTNGQPTSTVSYWLWVGGAD